MNKLLLCFTLIVAGVCHAQFTEQGSFTTNGQFTENASVQVSPVVIQTASLPDATRNVPYTPQTLAATGGITCGSPLYIFSVVPGFGSGLPTGFSILSGKIVGTTSLTGTFTFQVIAKDCASPQQTSSPQTLTLKVNPPAPTAPVVQTTSLPNTVQGTTYTPQVLQATGGTPCASPPYLWNLTGSLPTGITRAADTLSGSASAAPATYPFSVTATDCGSPPLTSTPQPLSITVVAPNGGGGGSPDPSSENFYCLSGDVCNFGTTDGPAQLPLAGLYTGTDGTPAPGITRNVVTAADLTAALTAANCGDVIQIQVGTLSGNWTLPNKPCDLLHWIWIESAQAGAAGFPIEHSRATPCSINQASVANYPSYPCPTPANLMPRLQTTTTNLPVLKTAAGANHYRILGVEITKAAGVLMDNALVSTSLGGDHILFDRDLIHGVPVVCTLATTYTCNTGDELSRALDFNACTFCGVINSWVWDAVCFTGCIDAQAVWTGVSSLPSGPLKVYNNLLTASGESVFSGGGGNNPVIPADFEIRHNHSYKPASWMLGDFGGGGGGQHPIPKNLGELKNGNRALIEGNVFENSWAGTTGWQSDQAGFAFLLTPKNQSTNIGCSLASSDGAGNLVCLSGNFGLSGASTGSTLVSSSCATPLHCHVKVSATFFQAQTWTDSTHINVSNAGVFPPAAASVSVFPCAPGVAGNVSVQNVVFRYNEIRNTTNGIQLGSVLSDCGDPTQGLGFVSIHDNLMHGLNYNLSNGTNTPQPGPSDALDLSNGQSSNVYHHVTYEHNTIAQVRGGTWSGLGQSLDATNTVAGSNGGYFANITVQNNISPGDWTPTWKAGATFPGGTLAGNNQQFCPLHDGLNCTGIFRRNVMGAAQWPGQTINKPYPITNADTTDSPAGTGCNASGATCFPSGPAFRNLFTSYNYAGVKPAGAIDVLDYMVPSDWATKHRTGTTNKYFYKDDKNIYWIKASNGTPADVWPYDDKVVYGGMTEGDATDNAVCVAAGFSSCFTDPNAWKAEINPTPWWPRYFVPGTDIITLTPGPNVYVKTATCGTDNQVIISNGDTKGEIQGLFTDILWHQLCLAAPGGSATTCTVADHAPYLLLSKFINGTGLTNFLNRERYYVPLDGGQMKWDHSGLSGGVYNVDQTTAEYVTASGGAPTPTFPAAACAIPTTLQRGIPAYKGNYSLATTTYAGAGSDGKDIGADLTTLAQYRDGPEGGNPARSDTNYTPALITTTSPLASATNGVAYTALQLTATSASDMQVWSLVLPPGSNKFATLPGGMSLSRKGVISGTPTAGTTAGTYYLWVQMMDAAQQYDRKLFKLIVN
jgi:hypothetical protein